jgi:hypothetical protein
VNPFKSHTPKIIAITAAQGVRIAVAVAVVAIASG